MHSPNFVDQNIEKLATLFPNCVTEAKNGKGKLTKAIDFDLLKQELSAHIVEGPQERYQLNWPGKREALLTANAPIAKTFRPVREESVDFDTTKNLFIEGDNLDALKLLQETYLSKVKMIYIDPPYNTGKDFIYKDSFTASKEDFERASGEINEEGGKLVSNPETRGRYHSDWLSMMYSRLRLANNFLRDDGVILISIDDSEQANLKKIADEIFGASNFVATLVWDRNRKNDAKYFSVGHDYMLVYFKNANFIRENRVVYRGLKEGVEDLQVLFNGLVEEYGTDWTIIREKLLDFYRSIPSDDPRQPLTRYRKVDKKGPYRSDGNINWPGGNGPTYEILHPKTKKPCKLPNSGWRYPTPKRFWEEVENGRIVFGDDEKTVPSIRTNLFEKNSQVMVSVHYSYAQSATNEFNDIFGGVRVFDNPKPIKDLKQLIGYLTDKDDIVMDFFAGSGTTAHSTMELNAEDNGSRYFVAIQLAEICSDKSEAFSLGFKTISDITKERIRRAGKKILAENQDKEGIENLDIGFRVLKVDSSNMAEVYYAPDSISQEDLFKQVDNVKEDRTEEDLLFQVMLDWGVDLTLPIQRKTIQDKTVFFVDTNALVACFDKDGGINEVFVKQLCEHEPLRAVFRDAGFADDDVKINVEQIFKQFSPHTDVKSI